MSDHRAARCGIIADLRDAPAMLPFRRADVPLDASTLSGLRIAFWLWLAAVIQMAVLATLAVFAAGGMGWFAFRIVMGPAIASILGAFVASAIVRRSARSGWASHGRAASAALLAARGQCPACGAWMLGADRDADGLTPCPKCRAAWKVGNTGGCPGSGYDMRSVPASAGPLAICPECATLSVASAGAGPRAPEPESAPPD